MLNTANLDEILAVIPHRKPFRFIETLDYVDTEQCKGSYTYKRSEYFYEGHFPEVPVTPSAILNETMAQIGLLPLGIVNHVVEFPEQDFSKIKPLFTSSNVRYSRPVYPGTKVIVESKKIYFRLGKLKAKVYLKNEAGEVCCSGVLSGAFLENHNLSF